MKFNRRKIIKKIVQLSFTIYFFILLYKTIDVKEVFSLLTHLPILDILLCILIYVLINALRSIRFQILLNQKLNIKDIEPVIMVHNFYNRILPFHIGEATLPFYMKKIYDISYSDSIFSLIILRMYDFITTCFIFFSCYLFVFLQNKIIVICCFPLFLLLSMSAIPVFMFLFDKICTKFPFINRKNYFQNFISTAKIKWKNFHFMNNCQLYFISCSIYFLFFFFFYILISDFHLDFSFTAVILAGSFSNLSSILPISMIGNLGTMELGFAGMLIFMGYPKEGALLSGFSVNLFTLFSSIFLGFLGLGILFFRKKLVNDDCEEIFKPH